MLINSLIIFIFGLVVECIYSIFLLRNINDFIQNKKISVVVYGFAIRFVFLIFIFYTLARLSKSFILMLSFVFGLTMAKVLLMMDKKKD